MPNNITSSNITRTTLTAYEAAQYLGISYWFVTQLVKRKQLPCIRMGNRLLFREETLRQYLEQLENDSVASNKTNDADYGILRKVKA